MGFVFGRMPFRSECYAMSKRHPPWDRWYKLGRWERQRQYQLRVEPFCRMCRDRGQVSAATVCDHIEPHKGDWNQFWLGPFQSLCAPCHDSLKRSVEIKGYAKGHSASGYPLDPNHPWYTGKV
jgi:5-methylcytosine-specific restriction enzyme A